MHHDAGPMKSTLQQSFEQCFGEDETQRILAAAEEHANEPNSENRGDDWFRWAFLICVRYQCVEKDSYREHHGIRSDAQELRDWALDWAWAFKEHNGDCDWLAAMGGAYTDYFGWDKE